MAGISVGEATEANAWPLALVADLQKPSHNVYGSGREQELNRVIMAHLAIITKSFMDCWKKKNVLD